MHRRIAELDDPASQMSLIWNEEHDRYVLNELLRIAELQFQPTARAAFQMTAIQRIQPKLVSEKLGLSVNAVLISKSRVLMRLRQDAKGLVESSSRDF